MPTSATISPYFGRIPALTGGSSRIDSPLTDFNAWRYCLFLSWNQPATTRTSSRSRKEVRSGSAHAPRRTRRSRYGGGHSHRHDRRHSAGPADRDSGPVLLLRRTRPRRGRRYDGTGTTGTDERERAAEQSAAGAERAERAGSAADRRKH